MRTRPIKLTEEMMNKIVTSIRAGNSRDVSARYAGVSPQSFFKWLAMGRKGTGDPLYKRLAEEVEQADAAAAVQAVATIRQAMSNQWQAAAWWLERRYPDEWGRKDRVSIGRLLEDEATRMAEQLGVTKEEVIADAERILAGSR